MIYILYGTYGGEDSVILAAFRDQDKAYEVRQKCEEHAKEEPPSPEEDGEIEEYQRRWTKWEEECPIEKACCYYYYIKEMELQ